MNQRPTPETDAQNYDSALDEFDGDIVDADFARNLERQRDEAREALRRVWDVLFVVSSAIEKFSPEIQDALAAGREALR